MYVARYAAGIIRQDAQNDVQIAILYLHLVLNIFHFLLRDEK